MACVSLQNPSRVVGSREFLRVIAVPRSLLLQTGLHQKRLVVLLLGHRPFFRRSRGGTFEREAQRLSEPIVSVAQFPLVVRIARILCQESVELCQSQAILLGGIWVVLLQA